MQDQDESIRFILGFKLIKINVIYPGSSKVFNFSISQEMLENVGIVVLVFSLSFAIVVISIVIFLHNFSCNINCNLSN